MNTLFNILMNISVLLLIFGLHQNFLSVAIFILRKNKAAQWKELSQKTPMNEFVPAETIQKWQGHWATSEKFKRAVNLPWFLYVFPSFIFVGTIFVVATLMVIKSELWWVGIYHLILVADLIWLLKMKGEVIEQTKIEKFWFIFPTIKFPSKILNIIFQPIWTIAPFIILIVIAALIKK
ncbi:MAG: hypothetical protein WC621_00455 [Patescibacteria group bacterium]